ncbi:hypothetical protein GGI07_003966 [Coemansia sp. Benny D115]|nr:hypothetical protein GGI07_003966 [Coemansia sp. Benny D115]
MAVRQATHAGSWYTEDSLKLDRELQGWLDNVPASVAQVEPPGTQTRIPVPGGVRAIIGPHAGYSYSGPNAAFAYKCINPQGVKRVFLLGPSHHVYLDKCALSQCREYETPLGNIPLDLDVMQELRTKGEWKSMSRQVDEDEHSLEMHLPYISKVFGQSAKLVPILVGNLSPDREAYYGRLLAPYLADAENLFIVSSDFCHWGSRFRYTYYRALTPDGKQPTGRVMHLGTRGGIPHGTPIWESIRRLDSDGMQAVAQMDHRAFSRYLDETENTICGRHPIGVLLACINELYPEGAHADETRGQQGPRLCFVKYDQSSKAVCPTDSSVSYASAYLHLPSSD